MTEFHRRSFLKAVGGLFLAPYVMPVSIEEYTPKELQIVARKGSYLSALEWRKTILEIRRHGYQIMEWSMYQYNDSQTRRNIHVMFTDLIEEFKSKKRVYDYQVVCDETNNTPTTIVAHELHNYVDLRPSPTTTYTRIKFSIIGGINQCL